MHRLVVATLIVLFAAVVQAAPPYRVLIVDGQNNHAWKATTPVLSKHLTDSGLYKVEVATSPEKGKDMSGFAPKFADYQAVISNYNGDEWSEPTKQSLVDYVSNGGALVIIHAANNSFPKWTAYNEMIGLGGWGGRNEKSGPYVRFRDGQIVKDTQAGPGGHHGKQHPFQVIVRNAQHPITAGMPTAWMHANDELYDKLRGPAENIDVLATAYADPATGGSGEHEPMIFTVKFGKGRVFHSPMGHSVEAMECAGFALTLTRGTEWAITGQVTQTKLPEDFPTADKVSVRK